MATNKNIQMSEFNGVDYDILLPQTRLDFELGNEYLWAKNQQAIIPNAKIVDASPYPISLLYNETDAKAQYSNTVKIINKKIEMVDPITVTFLELKSIALSLRGKYYMALSNTGQAVFGSNTLIYIAPNSVITLNTNNVFATQLYYPAISTELVEYVNNPSSNAYPPAIDDGYTYIPLGQLGAPQIVTGTYTGSGNDANCRVDVALGFRPKAVLVMANKYQFSGHGGAFFALAIDTEDAADNGYLELTDTGFAAKSTLATGDSDGYYPRNPFRYIAWH